MFKKKILSRKCAGTGLSILLLKKIYKRIFLTGGENLQKIFFKRGGGNLQKNFFFNGG